MPVGVSIEEYTGLLEGLFLRSIPSPISDFLYVSGYSILTY